MAITTIKKDKDYIVNRTTPVDDGCILEIYLSDENLTPSMYVKRYYMQIDEQEWHSKLRKDETERYIKKLSTNPEWD